MQWQDVMNFTQQGLVFYMQEGYIIQIMIPMGYSDMKTLLVCVQLLSIKFSTMKLQPTETQIFLGSDSDTKRMKNGKNSHDCTCPQFSCSSNFQ